MANIEDDDVSSPMVISLCTILEYSLDAPSGVKRASGNVRSIENLFEPGVPAYLDRQHPGIYAILLFYPPADTDIQAYLGTDALAHDSGPRILTFFALSHEARAPIYLPNSEAPPWLELNFDSHPAYRILRMIFEPKPSPPLPGLLFMSSLEAYESAVYVPLPQQIWPHLSTRSRLSSILSLADRAIGQDLRRDRYASDLALVLRRQGILYHRAGRGSAREFLFKAIGLLLKYRGDLVTMVKIGVGKP